VGKLERDQIENLALRRDASIETIEQWLRPNLAY